MNEENLKKLIAAIDEKKRVSENIAQTKAMDYVRSSDEKDRARAQAYLHDAELWAEARAIVMKHRGT